MEPTLIALLGTEADDHEAQARVFDGNINAAPIAGAHRQRAQRLRSAAERLREEMERVTKVRDNPDVDATVGVMAATVITALQWVNGGPLTPSQGEP